MITISWTISKGQILGTGNCPKINITENFSLPRFLGTYYEIRAYPYFYTLGKSCISWKFVPTDTDIIKVEVKHKTLETEETEVGMSSVVRPGVLLVSFPNSTITRADANFYVLSTDYDNYAVLYTCTNALFVNAQNAWILSRRSALEEVYLEKAIADMQAQGISPAFLGITLQTCGIN